LRLVNSAHRAELDARLWETYADAIDKRSHSRVLARKSLREN
jgi:hypothetical protein